MSSQPFDLGRGRSGPAANAPPMLGQRRLDKVAPYRIDMSDEHFEAVNDVVVCTLAPAKTSAGGIELPYETSPFHVALAVGPKVSNVLGVELEIGDVISIEGAPFADTLAGRVWFVRADKILSVITPKPPATERDDAAFLVESPEAHDTEPPPRAA